MDFRLSSEYSPTGDQPRAIKELVDGINQGLPAQTLLGVTGSGKTFTMANVIKEVKRPTLILSHNKTLAAQLYGEMKNFFPENAVEYFVSYYDYYQPEAYIPSVDKYIEKDLMINDEIDKLRLATTSALLSGRQDVIVVSSVSCIYGMGNPEDFNSNVIEAYRGRKVSRNAFLRELVGALYSRNEMELGRGNFRVKGDTVDIYLAYEEIVVRVTFWGDEIESVSSYYPRDNVILGKHDSFRIFPANIFVTSPQRMASGIAQIELDLGEQVGFFNREARELEAKRLYERVTYDVEMMREVGHCPGIENYSRYFDGRQPGMRPFCLLDYFPDNFLTIIDESHVTVPQIRAMYGGDVSRKMNLVEYGFRLPAALDNRPLKFEEFESLTKQVVYVSATPADYELEKSEGVVVEQLIRPTGLLDPIIEVRPSLNQIDDLMEEIQLRIERQERVLVTTLTKRMAEELNDYLTKLKVKTAYIHSDVDTLDRIRILDDLRAGVYDVLIGVNLLREGLDLPEVSLVAILDAAKEGCPQSRRPRDNVCRQDHREHAAHHRRDRTAPTDTARIQRGARHHASGHREGPQPYNRRRHRRGGYRRAADIAAIRQTGSQKLAARRPGSEGHLRERIHNPRGYRRRSRVPLYDLRRAAALHHPQARGDGRRSQTHGIHRGGPSARRGAQDGGIA